MTVVEHRTHVELRPLEHGFPYSGNHSRNADIELAQDVIRDCDGKSDARNVLRRDLDAKVHVVQEKWLAKRPLTIKQPPPTTR